MLTSDFDYHLPPELIAQQPLARRDDSRLMVAERSSGRIAHRLFRELGELLTPGDLLVMNDTRVFPARLHGTRETSGGRVEALFLHEESPGRWLAMTRSGGALRPGETLVLAQGLLRAKIVERRAAAGDLLEIPEGFGLPAFLDRHGEVPLPPYIHRADPAAPSADRARYQTVYARSSGAVAAPTAGLHFTPELLADLEHRGVRRTMLTLHVGPGTFQPVKAERVEDHHLLPERYELGEATAGLVNQTRAAGRRAVAVGTTVARTVESAADDAGQIRPGEGWTGLFIHPPYRFKAVDALVTNFHLPKSTLIMLVAAFAGRELVLEAYRQAVAARYRFYSYGDCCIFL